MEATDKPENTGKTHAAHPSLGKLLAARAEADSLAAAAHKAGRQVEATFYEGRASGINFAILQFIGD